MGLDLYDIVWRVEGAFRLRVRRDEIQRAFGSGTVGELYTLILEKIGATRWPFCLRMVSSRSEEPVSRKQGITRTKDACGASVASAACFVLTGSVSIRWHCIGLVDTRRQEPHPLVEPELIDPLRKAADVQPAAAPAAMAAAVTALPNPRRRYSDSTATPATQAVGPTRYIIAVATGCTPNQPTK
jgi:hypothetical protein